MAARKMTADEAKTFDRFSAVNAAQAVNDLVDRGVCDGTCQAYHDVFTFKRWQAQGYQVQRGQHGVKLAVIVQKDEIGEDGKPVQIPWTTTVFCRHQIAPKAS